MRRAWGWVSPHQPWAGGVHFGLALGCAVMRYRDESESESAGCGSPRGLGAGALTRASLTACGMPRWLCARTVRSGSCMADGNRGISPPLALAPCSCLSRTSDSLSAGVVLVLVWERARALSFVVYIYSLSLDQRLTDVSPPSSHRIALPRARHRRCHRRCRRSPVLLSATAHPPRRVRLTHARYIYVHTADELTHGYTTSPTAMTIAQFHGCAVLAAPDLGRRRIYELIVRQEPKQARMCGVGGKGALLVSLPSLLPYPIFPPLATPPLVDVCVFTVLTSALRPCTADRRPIDPPPIVQLRVIDPATAPPSACSQRPPRAGAPPRAAGELGAAVHRDRQFKGIRNYLSKAAGQGGTAMDEDAAAGYAQSFLQNPYYFMFASLARPDDDNELHWLKVRFFLYFFCGRDVVEMDG